MKLLGKRILLKETAPKEQPAILLIDPKPVYEVSEIGDEVTKVEIGQQVYYKYADKVKIDNQDYILVTEDEIIAILWVETLQPHNK